jgi:hypothetical protein
VGSRFVDWIYWTPLLQLYLITSYISSHIELLPNDICLLSRCLVALQLLNPQILTTARPFVDAGESNRDHRLQRFHYCCSCLRCAGYACNTVVTKPVTQQRTSVLVDSVTLGNVFSLPLPSNASQYPSNSQYILILIRSFPCRLFNNAFSTETISVE